MTTTTEPAVETLRQQVSTLKLHGLLAHWDELTDDALAWVAQWIDWETRERARRGLQRRLRAAHIGRFKPLADFDWDWPAQCDKAAVSTLMQLDFIAEAFNVFNTVNYDVNSIDNSEFFSGPTLANPNIPYTPNPNFGQYRATLDPLEVQLGVRWWF